MQEYNSMDLDLYITPNGFICHRSENEVNQVEYGDKQIDELFNQYFSSSNMTSFETLVSTMIFLAQEKFKPFGGMKNYIDATYKLLYEGYRKIFISDLLSLCQLPCSPVESVRTNEYHLSASMSTFYTIMQEEPLKLDQSAMLRVFKQTMEKIADDYNRHALSDKGTMYCQDTAIADILSREQGIYEMIWILKILFGSNNISQERLYVSLVN